MVLVPANESSAEPTSIRSVANMKRQRIPQQQQQQRQQTDYISGDVSMFDLRRSHDSDEDGSDAGGRHSDMPLQQRSNNVSQRPRNVLEAQVQEGDTLQAIAIRYRCSVADIKRLNKIERDYEIHAHKTLQVPLTAENVLADHLIVDAAESAEEASIRETADQMRAMLNAQAAGHNGTAANTFTPNSTQTTSTAFPNANDGPSINEIILNTKIQPNLYLDSAEAVNAVLSYDEEHSIAEQTLLIGSGDDDAFVRQPRPIRAGGGGVLALDLSCSGSDCDISWTVLLVCILALCFAIPLIYVLYIAEHHVDAEQIPAHPAAVSHSPVAAAHQSDQHWDT